MYLLQISISIRDIFKHLFKLCLKTKDFNPTLLHLVSKDLTQGNRFEISKICVSMPNRYTTVFFIFKLDDAFLRCCKQIHTPYTHRHGRINMQYKFQLGRWTDGRNVRIIHPSLFSPPPLFSSQFLPSIIYSKIRIRVETHGTKAEIEGMNENREGEERRQAMTLNENA